MRLHELRRVLRPRPEVFAYAADLANAEEWDPIVISARQVGSDPVGPGAKFELVVRFGAASIPMLYEIAEYEPDYRVVLAGRNDHVEVVDEIKFLDDGEDTIIDYTGNLHFSGYFKFAGPLIAPFIRRAGRRSVDALVANLEG